MGRRNPPQQCGLARIRVTDEPGVRDRPQLQDVCPLLSFLTLRILTRRAIPSAFEMDVSLAAATAMAKNKFFVSRGEVSNLFERRLGRGGSIFATRGIHRRRSIG